MYIGKSVKIYVDNSRDARLRPHPPAIIVKRAMSKLGKVKYDLFTNNCEHFANWCRYDKAESQQVEKAIGIISTVALQPVPSVFRPGGTKCSVIYREIVENYGEQAMSMTQVYLWCSWFKDGRTSLQDEPRSGRPDTANNDRNTARVEELIKVDRRVKLKEISPKLDIPKTDFMKLSMINLAIAKFLPDGSPKCCQMIISTRDSKSSKSSCTGVNKKVMKPLVWGLAGTIVPGTSFLNISSLEMKLGYT
ncbi:hras-like suppressor 3 [Plakobranchus ocellatus]|uniref:Hras-like suppressor 3 n=1 Tax=Plakobranchus ocellatus TaxID=259542 RepID=A0AAV4BR56_9GAST|nr:hras-like suppressor 3 [Plakobranchus ocellatus]